MPPSEDDVIRNSTASIYGILKPYWRKGALEDQHWKLIAMRLKAIEMACGECPMKSNRKEVKP